MKFLLQEACNSGLADSRARPGDRSRKAAVRRAEPHVRDDSPGRGAYTLRMKQTDSAPPCAAGAAAGPPGGSDDTRPLALGLGGAAFVFVFIVALVAVGSIHRNEDAMGRLLAEKGSTLVSTLERVLGLGLRSQAGIPLQSLLDTLGTSRDVRFIAVTMPDGTILAHSQRNRRGEILLLDGREMDENRMKGLHPDGKMRYGFLNMENKPVFVVYRQFMPPPPELAGRFPTPVIFLGLDPSPFDITRQQDRDYMIILAGVALLVGLACLMALYYAERARQSRRGQRRAEGEVRRLEEEMRRKEKLAAVGTLAAGVAHEIRNPLSSIKGYATYFGQRFPEDSEDRKAAEVMVREVDRLNRVITDLIGLSRPTDIHPRPTRLDDVMEHVLRLIRQDAAHHHIRLESTADAQLPPASIDPDRLGQALLNICLNALDALQGAPDSPPLEGEAILRLDARREKDMLRLDVIDNGHGIAPENLRHVFDPYFTTKGHGTGLGLATVHKIVEAHGGTVGVRSRQAGNGRRGETVVSLRLPVAAGSARGRNPKEKA